MNTIFSIPHDEIWAIAKERQNAILREMEHLRQIAALQTDRTPLTKRRAAERLRHLLGEVKRRLRHALAFRPK